MQRNDRQTAEDSQMLCQIISLAVGSNNQLLLQFYLLIKVIECSPHPIRPDVELTQLVDEIRNDESDLEKEELIKCYLMLLNELSKKGLVKNEDLSILETHIPIEFLSKKMILPHLISLFTNLIQSYTNSNDPIYKTDSIISLIIKCIDESHKYTNDLSHNKSFSIFLNTLIDNNDKENISELLRIITSRFQHQFINDFYNYWFHEGVQGKNSGSLSFIADDIINKIEKFMAANQGNGSELLNDILNYRMIYDRNKEFASKRLSDVILHDTDKAIELLKLLFDEKWLRHPNSHFIDDLKNTILDKLLDRKLTDDQLNEIVSIYEIDVNNINLFNKILKVSKQSQSSGVIDSIDNKIESLIDSLNETMDEIKEWEDKLDDLNIKRIVLENEIRKLTENKNSKRVIEDFGHELKELNDKITEMKNELKESINLLGFDLILSCKMLSLLQQHNIETEVISGLRMLILEYEPIGKVGQRQDYILAKNTCLAINHGLKSREDVLSNLINAYENGSLNIEPAEIFSNLYILSLKPFDHSSASTKTDDVSINIHFPYLVNYFIAQNHEGESLNRINKLVEKMIERYEIRNRDLKDNQKIDFSILALRYAHKIVNLCDIMGTDQALKYLSTQIEKSCLHFKRFLDSYHPLSGESADLIKKLVHKFENDIDKESKRDVWRDLFHLAYVYEATNVNAKKLIEMPHVTDDDSDMFSKIMQEANSDNITLEKIMEDLKKLVLSIYADYLGLSEKDTDNDKLNKMLECRFFPTLLTACHSISHDYYRGVFELMVRADLSTSKFDVLIHDRDQDNELGRAIANHNAKISEELGKSGINVENAQRYSKQHAFTYNAMHSIKKDYAVIGSAITGDLNELKSALFKAKLKLPECDEKMKLERYIIRLMDKIDNFYTQFNKGKKPLADKIQTEGNKKNISDIVTVLKDPAFTMLLNAFEKDNMSDIKKSLVEFSDHFREHAKELTKAPATALTTGAYHVEHWDKSNIDTFFLGNYLSCCLATDGSNFQAIVQRRLDDAMAFHVVIDESSQEPVAGSWLFFAKDASNNPVLVANFLEIRSDYATDSGLRNTLIKELLRFTGDMYVPDCGFQEFIIRPLTYGMLRHSLEELPMVNTTLQKIGGFCLLGDTEEDDAKAFYYLNALDEHSFHAYSKEALDMQFPAPGANNSFTTNRSSTSHSPSVASFSLLNEMSKDQTESRPTSTSTQKPRLGIENK